MINRGHFCSRKGYPVTAGELIVAIHDRPPRVPRLDPDNPMNGTTKRGCTKPYSTNPKVARKQKRAVRIRAQVQAEFTRAWKRGEI